MSKSAPSPVVDHIIARAAKGGIATEAAQSVMACSAKAAFKSRLEKDTVIAGSTATTSSPRAIIKEVDAVAAIHNVVALAAEQRIRAALAEEQILACSPSIKSLPVPPNTTSCRGRRIRCRPAAGENCIVAVKAENEVHFAVANDGVGPWRLPLILLNCIGCSLGLD